MATHDVVLYYLLNASSALYLSAAHNALYFVLGWHTVVLHFWHYCLTFCFLLLCSVIGMQRWSKPLPISPFILPITTQIIIVLLSNRIHSQIRSGSLYLLRCVSYHKSTKTGGRVKNKYVPYSSIKSGITKVESFCKIFFAKFLKFL